MTEKKSPAYQHYAKDFLAGTADMSISEVGAYIRLLDQAWDSNPIATLPNDDERLRRLAGADKDEWAHVKAAVLTKFIVSERFEGRLLNQRMRAYYEELQEYKDKLSETASERGKKGAAKRWKKETNSAAPVTKGFDSEEAE